jgi:hypothetical protein
MNTNDLIEKRKNQLNLILDWAKKTANNPLTANSNNNIVTSSTTGSIVSSSDSPNLSPVNSSHSTPSSSVSSIPQSEKDQSDQTLLPLNTNPLVSKLNLITVNNESNTCNGGSHSHQMIKYTTCYETIDGINNSISMFDCLGNLKEIRHNNRTLNNNDNYDKNNIVSNEKVNKLI